MPEVVQAMAGRHRYDAATERNQSQRQDEAARQPDTALPPLRRK
jgi:hypothetical protein